MWKFPVNWLHNEEKRKIAAFLGGGLVVVVGALWSVYTYNKSDEPSLKPSDSITIGNIQSGNDIVIGPGTIDKQTHVKQIYNVYNNSELAKQLGVAENAAEHFKNELDRQQVPREDWNHHLRQSAVSYKKLLHRAEQLGSAGSMVQPLRTQAIYAINTGDFTKAAELFDEAEQLIGEVVVVETEPPPSDDIYAPEATSNRADESHAITSPPDSRSDEDRNGTDGHTLWEYRFGVGDTVIIGPSAAGVSDIGRRYDRWPQFFSNSLSDYISYGEPARWAKDWAEMFNSFMNRARRGYQHVPGFHDLMNGIGGSDVDALQAIIVTIEVPAAARRTGRMWYKFPSDNLVLQYSVQMLMHPEDGTMYEFSLLTPGMYEAYASTRHIIKLYAYFPPFVLGE